MTFTNVFGGETVYSAEVNYREVALSANVTLQWPTELASSGDILASIMDVDPTAGGFTIRLPAANLASVGETALFFNVGSNSFTIADNGGNTIVSVAPGIAWQVYLTDNTTTNGAWRTTQYGAGASAATAGSLVGAGIKAIGTSLNQSMQTTTINTNYNATAGDRSSVLNWIGGAGSVSLASSVTIGNDWFLHIRNSGTGGLTIQPSVGGQLINGGASILMNPGDGLLLFCDGTNYFTIGFGGGGGDAGASFDFVSIDLTGQPSPYFLTGANLNRIAYRFVGTITADLQVIVPDTIQEYWAANETSLASDPFTITVKTLLGSGVGLVRNTRAILYCDGVNVVNASTAGVSLPIGIPQGGTGATDASGARTNLGATATGSAVFTAASAAAARGALGLGDLATQSAPLTVSQGGTGATSLTGVLIGTGTTPVTVKTNPAGAFVGTTDVQTVSGKTFTNYTENVFTITDGATVDLDPNNGPIQVWTLGANRTPGQANWAAGQSITLMIDDGTARTITWTTLGVVWETNGGTAPVLATSGFTVVVLWKVGSTIYGARVGDA